MTRCNCGAQPLAQELENNISTSEIQAPVSVSAEYTALWLGASTSKEIAESEGTIWILVCWISWFYLLSVFPLVLMLLLWGQWFGGKRYYTPSYILTPEASFPSSAHSRIASTGFYRSRLLGSTLKFLSKGKLHGRSFVSSSFKGYFQGKEASHDFWRHIEKQRKRKI